MILGLSCNKKVRKYKRTGKSKAHPNEYRIWLTMKTRCYNKNRTNYKYYGGRGIKVCDRWLGIDGFDNFYADMGERPVGYTLDRIDADKDYCPENCRWASMNSQNINKKIIRSPYIYFDNRRKLYRVAFRSLRLPGKQFLELSEAREYRNKILSDYGKEEILAVIMEKEHYGNRTIL